MTREERNNAIKVLKNFDLNNPKINSLLFSADEITNAFNMAIKALEQEPILDKIREQITSNLRGVEIALEVLARNHPLRQKMEGAKDTLEDCLELIDKAEREE